MTTTTIVTSRTKMTSKEKATTKRITQPSTNATANRTTKDNARTTNNLWLGTQSQTLTQVETK